MSSKSSAGGFSCMIPRVDTGKGNTSMQASKNRETSLGTSVSNDTPMSDDEQLEQGPGTEHVNSSGSNMMKIARSMTAALTSAKETFRSGFDELAKTCGRASKQELEAMQALLEMHKVQITDVRNSHRASRKLIKGHLSQYDIVATQIRSREATERQLQSLAAKRGKLGSGYTTTLGDKS